MSDLADWKQGDAGFYVLPQGYGRQRPLFLAVTVKSVGRVRVTVQPRNGAHRVVKSQHLVKAAPEGAWIK